jgi:hypothetical protein
MPNVRASTGPLDFDALTKKQKDFVRKLTWEMLKTEAPFIVIIPSIICCLGVIVGFVIGVFLGRLVFSAHPSRSLAICVVIGAGIGAGIGQIWLQRECQSHFKRVIREHENEISKIV